MENKILKYIENNNLFTGKDKLLLAVSGGADSVVMFHILHELKYKIGIAHCNFNLRGEDSNQDEIFVKELAEKYNIELYSKSFNTKEYAKENKYSVEEAARILRYDFFEEARKKKEYDYILTAHHSDDNIETFFINLIAGTGIRGITGIKNKNGKIIRPLSDISKGEIIEYCKKNNLDYRTDKSNFENNFTRNKIRNKIIPLIEEIKPSFNSIMKRNFEIFNDIEKIYFEAVEQSKIKCFNKEGQYYYINISKLLKVTAPKTILFEILKDFGFNSSQVEGVFCILNSESGKMFYSETHILLKDREFLILKENKKQKADLTIINKETQAINEPLKISFTEKEYSDMKINPDKNFAFIDAEKLSYPLMLKKISDGDFFYPLGMKGKKLLSDFLTDLKLNIFDKEETYLLLSGDEIMWVVGHRIDNRYKVTDKTRKVLICKYFPNG